MSKLSSESFHFWPCFWPKLDTFEQGDWHSWGAILRALLCVRPPGGCGASWRLRLAEGMASVQGAPRPPLRGASRPTYFEREFPLFLAVAVEKQKVDLATLSDSAIAVVLRMYGFALLSARKLHNGYSGCNYHCSVPLTSHNLPGAPGAPGALVCGLGAARLSADAAHHGSPPRARRCARCPRARTRRRATCCSKPRPTSRSRSWRFR